MFWILNSVSIGEAFPSSLVYCYFSLALLLNLMEDEISACVDELIVDALMLQKFTRIDWVTKLKLDSI